MNPREANRKNQPTVLLVDDQPESIDVLKSALDQHFIIKVAIRGDLAIKIAETGSIDLILLDIMMPEMDGYEVCRRLKANPVTLDIPIIFITSKESHEDEATGLELGAVDFIRKPSSPSVVLARTCNTIAHKHAKEDLHLKNQELQLALELREDMERLSRHDLKGPLSGILGIPQLLLGEAEAENFTEGQKRLLKMIESSGYIMLEMINRSLDLFKMENGSYHFEPEIFDMSTVLERIVGDLERKYSEPSRINIRTESLIPAKTDGAFDVVGDKMLCYSLFYNLVLNAVEASPDRSQVHIKIWPENNFCMIKLTNAGEVPQSIRERFFSKYVTAGKSGGIGLGTYSAWLATKTQGGTIELDTSQRGHTSVTVSLPGPR